MLDSKQTVELMLTLNEYGIDDSYNWIKEHTEEECIEYLNTR